MPDLNSSGDAQVGLVLAVSSPLRETVSALSEQTSASVMGLAIFTIFNRTSAKPHPARPGRPSRPCGPQQFSETATGRLYNDGAFSEHTEAGGASQTHGAQPKRVYLRGA